MNGKSNCTLCALLITISLMASSAQADIKFSGFGSVVGGMTLSSDDSQVADFVNYAGAQYDNDFSLRPESRFGLQASSELSDGLTATAQILASGSGDFNAKMSWAYLSYEVNDNLTLQAGRKGVDFFEYYSYRKVGYAFDWIRAPLAVYNIPFDSMDQINALYTSSLGSFDLTSNVYFGHVSYNDPVFENAEINIDNILGGNISFSHDSGFYGRFSHLFGNMRLAIPTSGTEAFKAFLINDLGAPAEIINPMQAGNDLTSLLFGVDKVSLTFSTVSLGYDTDSFYLRSEFLAARYDDLLADTDAYFVTLGLRLGEWTPHVTYQAFAEDEHMGGVHDMAGYIVGVRYNFHPSASFKLDFTSYTKDNSMLFGGKTESVAFGIDFVF